MRIFSHRHLWSVACVAGKIKRAVNLLMLRILWRVPAMAEHANSSL